MPVLSNKETMVLPVNRRSFLYRVAAGAAAVLLGNSCAGAPSAKDRDTLKEIKTIWDKEPSDPADVDRLKEIMLPWGGEESIEIVVEAERALALHNHFFVIPTYVELMRKWYANPAFVRNLIPSLAFNFIVSPAARLKHVFFLWRLADQLAPRATLKVISLDDREKEQAKDASRFWGAAWLQLGYHLLSKAQKGLILNSGRIEQLQSNIQDIDPSFKPIQFPSDDAATLREELNRATSDKEIIEALRKLHTKKFILHERLLPMLKNASPELVKVIVAILGSNLAFTVEIEDVMLDYLAGSDGELVVAAAKALRFKENLPAKKIAKILEQHRKKNPALGQQLDDILLSTLVSEDDALKDVFAALIWNMFNTEAVNKADKFRRLNEIRIWYWRLSINRKNIGYRYSVHNDMDILEYNWPETNENNNRNVRVRLAMPEVPADIQEFVIKFLRQFPAFVNPGDPLSREQEEQLVRDEQQLQHINNMLRLTIAASSISAPDINLASFLQDSLDDPRRK